MKKHINSIIYIFIIPALLCLMSCQKEQWGNDNPEYENVFYFGFQDWGRLMNDVTFSVAQGETIGIPVQFWCSGSRSFNAVSFYYVTTDLRTGTDYQIVDAQGKALTPNADGAYEMTWNLNQPDTTDNHRINHIYLKALHGAKGDLTLQTFNPNDTAAISNNYTPNNLTPQYEVHTFTQNYKVKVSVK